MTLRITPFDTVFFRDGKPFALGEESWADGIFPPPPSVLSGAVRSAAIAAQLGAAPLQSLIQATETIEIQGSWLLFGEKEQLFPAPLDLYMPDDENSAQPMSLQTVDFASNFPSALTQIFCSTSEGKTEEAAGKWLSKADLSKYIAGETAEFKWKKLDDIKTEELKTGIGRNDEKHIAEDGQLYRYAMQRAEILEMDDAGEKGQLKKLAILVRCENLPTGFPAFGALQLGGERKAAAYAEVKASLPPPPVIAGNVFKIVLLTPGIFAGTGGQGWWPEHFFQAHGLRLLAAATGKPLSIGGFDVKEKQPKPMRKAVPAGSVYVVEAPASLDLTAFLTNTLHGKSLCEDATDRRQGFGIALAANLSPNQHTQLPKP